MKFQSKHSNSMLQLFQSSLLPTWFSGSSLLFRSNLKCLRNHIFVLHISEVPFLRGSFLPELAEPSSLHLFVEVLGNSWCNECTKLNIYVIKTGTSCCITYESPLRFWTLNSTHPIFWIIVSFLWYFHSFQESKLLFFGLFHGNHSPHTNQIGFLAIYSIAGTLALHSIWWFC